MDLESIATAYVGMLTDPASAARLAAPGCKVWLSGRPLPAGTTLEQRVERFRAAFPDGAMTTTVLATSPDSVTLEYHFRGTHTGVLGRGAQQFPPTGRTVTYSGLSFLRIREGKVVEERAYPDSASLLDQVRGG